MNGDFYLLLIASLAVTIGAGLLFWGYKYLLARLNKNDVAPKPYVTLKPVYVDKEHHHIEVMLEVPEPLEVNLNIVAPDGNVLKNLCDKELNKGNHKFQWDWNGSKNDKLFCQLVTNYQKTEKIVTL